MITPGYCQTMARYNAWQNSGLRDIIGAVSIKDLNEDRGAFFGSIMGTLNHLLWGDAIWISRFDGGEGPDPSIAESVDFTPSAAVWDEERARMDARIMLWAQQVVDSDLAGDLSWYSGAAERQMTLPKAVCVMQLFNHQTHHRGQVHAMLTALGHKPTDTDLPFMPVEG